MFIQELESGRGL